MRTADADTYAKVFLEMLDGHLKVADETSGNAPPYRHRFNADGSYWHSSRTRGARLESGEDGERGALHQRHAAAKRGTPHAHRTSRVPADLRVVPGLTVVALGKSHTPDPRRVVVEQSQADPGGSTSVRNTDAGWWQWKTTSYFLSPTTDGFPDVDTYRDLEFSRKPLPWPGRRPARIDPVSRRATSQGGRARS